MAITLMREYLTAVPDALLVGRVDVSPGVIRV
jgi:hypothetical protein